MRTLLFLFSASSARRSPFLFVAAAMAVVVGFAVMIGPRPALAQAEGQVDTDYAREAMEQSLVAKRSYDLYGIHFATGEAAFLPEAETVLDDIAATLNHYPTWRLRIRGHTDATGDRDNNAVLSQKRADAVEAALVERGIAATRLEAVGVGQNEPVASNDTEDGRALNRRVELIRLDP